jgi:4-methyl-5(b-hydroxyethyl)-thiazole monophosphate biosynthesis
VLHGACGQLAGRRWTGYPGTEGSVTGAEFVAERVVVDGKLITARAAGCAGEFSRALVAALVGEEEAAELAAKVLLG